MSVYDDALASFNMNEETGGRVMREFTFRKYVETIPKDIECLLAADIGGTNSNFGIFQQKNSQLNMLFSLHTKSQTVKNFTDVVRDVLEQVQKEYNIILKYCCFAAAGVPSEDRMYCKPTNLDFVIDAQDIMKNTDLECAFIVNDFLVIGYGLSSIDEKDLIKVNQGNVRFKANKAILGAGTGLGKSILYWSDEYNRYIPLPSEGGHADFVVQNHIEYDLMAFIRKNEGQECNVSWEDVLSGDGIRRLYTFFRSCNSDDIKSLGNGPHPDVIFNACNEDEHCKKTYELYKKLYARCAKNFALDALALGGIYIAGGIAAHNVQMFREKGFMEEFINCGKQQELLKTVPIFIVADYNVSLYGAAQYLVMDNMCDK